MLDQLQPATEQPSPPPPVSRVRQDLYDEGLLRRRLRADALDVRGHHGADRRRARSSSPRSSASPTTPSSSTSASSRRLRPLDEFKDPQSLKEGDEVEVFLEHLEDQEGAVVLSKKKADFMRVWEKIRVAHESDEPVEGTLVKKIKGGVVVNLMGVDAFLPAARSRSGGCRTSTSCSGQTYEFKIIKLNKRPAQHRGEPAGDPGERAAPTSAST
jgi:hypothetical protein